MSQIARIPLVPRLLRQFDESPSKGAIRAHSSNTIFVLVIPFKLSGMAGYGVTYITLLM